MITLVLLPDDMMKMSTGIFLSRLARPYTGPIVSERNMTIFFYFSEPI